MLGIGVLMSVEAGLNLSRVLLQLQGRERDAPNVVCGVLVERWAVRVVTV